MSAHTPGPWAATMHPETGEWSVEEREGIVAVIPEARSWEAVSHVVRSKRNADGSGGFLVSASPANWPNTLADAHLIAAAPDLLDVAKQCAELAEKWGEQGPLVRAARAAIAKAEGRQP